MDTNNTLTALCLKHIMTYAQNILLDKCEGILSYTVTKTFHFMAITYSNTSS